MIRPLIILAFIIVTSASPIMGQSGSNSCIGKILLQKYDNDSLAKPDLSKLAIHEGDYVFLEVYDSNNTKMYTIAFGQKNDGLRFDIEIEPTYRGRGLYQYLMKYVLDFYDGKIKAIPAKMSLENSDNVRIFASQVFSENSFRSIENSSQLARMTTDQIIELRKSIVSGWKNTPAMKARTRNGYATLKKIIIDTRTGEVSFVAEKGADDFETEVLIVPSKGLMRIKNINADGSINDVSNDSLRIANYMTDDEAEEAFFNPFE